MKLKLVNKKQETSDVTSFFWESEEPVEWTAGQYFHYVLPHDNPDDRGVERWFTISNAPFEGNLRITTRFAGDSSSTFKKALFAKNIGDTIEGDNVEGDFVFKTPEEEYIWIAGGIGITPYRAISKDLEYKGIKPKITLFYSNRDSDFVFKDELEKVASKNPNFKINYLISPQRIDEEFLKENIQDFQKPIFYISGPEPMVDSLGETLKSLGVPEDHLVQDWFPGYPVE